MPPREYSSTIRKKRPVLLDKQTASPTISRDKRKGTTTVSLRIPASMLKEIDKAVKGRPYRMPRHMWLLEAVHEKLTRVRAAGPNHS
jgi:hypothetical protein